MMAIRSDREIGSPDVRLSREGQVCYSQLCGLRPSVLGQDRSRTKMKKRSERRKHCALATIKRSQKISPRRRPPPRGRLTAKM